MEQKLYLEVLKNLEQLFETKENYDVIIQAGEEFNQKEIYAHSFILCCQSNYFRTAFSTNWTEKKSGRYIFKKPNISPHIFEIILRYLYCGQINLSVENGSDILNLFVTTNEFGLHILCEYIQEFLNNNQEVILRQDPIGVLTIVFQHETFATLKGYYLETICQEPDILFGTNKILALPEQILESLLGREDLALYEIEIWDNLIKWSHARHPTVDVDTSKWTEEDIVLMKNTLSKFIPLIRFHYIKSKEYYDKVSPYRDLLSDKLKHEILQFYSSLDIKQLSTLPSRSAINKIDSVIIKAKHLALFAGWIDKKDKALKQNPFEFNLIFRGSLFGFNSIQFHAKCDNKGATIVVARIKNSHQIVGGYNPLDWNGRNGGGWRNWRNGGGFKSTTDSFIYFFNDYRNINTGIIGRVIQTQFAVWGSNGHDNSGPLFGVNCNGSSDLMCLNGQWSSVTNSYPNLNIPRHFEIDDYEVFQVVKKK